MKILLLKSIFPVQDMKACGGAGGGRFIDQQAFITSPLEGYDWSASYSGRKEPPVSTGWEAQ